MDFLQSYFPTPKLRRVELRLHALLDRELLRLQALPDPGIVAETLPGELAAILDFTQAYQNLYMDFLEAALPQHQEKIRCGAGCANCCHHYPMSVEPFELISLYAHLRNQDDFSRGLESCLHRMRAYARLQPPAPDEQDYSEEEEEAQLHRYFSQKLACPFIRANGDCGVYTYRPLTCRMYFSLTDPQFCVPEHLQTPLNRSFIVYLPDEIEEKIAAVTAYYAHLELPEGLYPGLLAINGFEGYFA